MPFNAAVAYSWCLYQNQNWFRFLKELFPKLTRVNKQGKKKNMEKNKKYIFIGIWKKQKIKKKKVLKVTEMAWLSEEIRKEKLLKKLGNGLLSITLFVAWKSKHSKDLEK